MFFIYADDELLYAPNLAGEGYGVINPVLTMELNRASSLSFTLPSSNIMYNSLKKMKTIITVFEDDKQLFRGRVLHDERNYSNNRTVYCEGELSFLLDSIIRPYEHHGAPSVLFKQFIRQHNAQVGSEKRFQIGTVKISDNNNYVYYASSQYPNTWSELEEKILNNHGGILTVDNQVISYTYDLDYSDQVIEFGRNLLDFTEYISADEVFTTLIPLGKILDDENAEESESTNAEEKPEKRLTIEAINNGKDYIENENAVALFGRITKVNTWDDVSEASILLTKATSYLEDGVNLAFTMTIKAVDLHVLEVNEKRIKVGQMVRILSIPHGIDAYMQCTKIVIDMTNADKSEYTLGVQQSGLTGRYIASKADENAAVLAKIRKRMIGDNARGKFDWLNIDEINLPSSNNNKKG